MTVKELKKILKQFKDSDIVQVVSNWDNMNADHPERIDIEGYAVVEPDYVGWESVDELAVKEIYLY